MQDVDKTMNISSEEKFAENNKERLKKEAAIQKEKEIREKRKNWFFSIIISAIAIIPIPVICFFRGDYLDSFLYLVGDISIIFIAISFTTTMLNDFPPEKDNFKINIIQILMLFGAIIYAVLKVMDWFGDDITQNSVCLFNGLYFIVMFFISFLKYKEEIKKYQTKDV